MKKILSFIISTAVTFSALPSGLSVSSAEKTDMSMTAQEFLDDITLGWNLGDDLDCCGDIKNPAPEYWEVKFGNPPVQKSNIDTVLETGINTIRVPVTWMGHLDENGDVSEEWMNRVQEVVDYVIDDGAYCIINVHHDTNFISNPYFEGFHATRQNYNEYKDEFQHLWEQISDRFRNYDYHLIFEGFNEMINPYGNAGKESLDVINDYNQLFVDTVRATGGNNSERILSCNTYSANAWSYDYNKAFELPNDSAKDKLFCQVHVYDPWDFVTNTSAQISDYVGYMTSFKCIKETLVDRDIPVLIGEFGSIHKQNTAERVKWVESHMAYASDLNIKSIYWDNGSTLFSRYFNQWMYPEVIESVLKSCGIDYKCPDRPFYDEIPNNLTTDYSRYMLGRYTDGGQGELSADYEKNEVKLHVTDGGSAPGSMDLFYSDVPFEAGKKYKISFDARCSGIEKLPAVFQVYQLKSENFAQVMYCEDKSITLTNEPQHFEYIVDMTNPEEKFCFYTALHLGNADATEPYDAYWSKLCVTEYNAPSGDVNADREFNVADLVMLSNWILNKGELTEWGNGDFTADGKIDSSDLSAMRKELVRLDNEKNNILSSGEWNYHATSGKSKISINKKSYSIYADVYEPSKDSWNIQTQIFNLRLEANKKYEISYDASCCENAEIISGLCRVDDGSYPTYYVRNVALTPEKKHYTFEIDTIEKTFDDYFWYFDFGAYAGSYKIENLRLVEK